MGASSGSVCEKNEGREDDGNDWICVVSSGSFEGSGAYMCDDDCEDPSPAKKKRVEEEDFLNCGMW